MKKEIRKELFFYAPTHKIKEEIDKLTLQNVAKEVTRTDIRHEEIHKNITTLLNKSFKEKKKLVRKTVAGVLIGDTLCFGVSECSRKDVFKRVAGRGTAKGRALSNPIRIVKITNEDTLSKIFLENAKELI